MHSKFKKWFTSVLKLDLFITLETLLNLWYLWLVVGTGIYWVLKYIYEMFNLCETTCGYLEHLLILYVVYILEGCDHSISKREYFLTHWQTQYGFYALTREHSSFYFVRAGALKEISVIREDYYRINTLHFFMSQYQITLLIHWIFLYVTLALPYQFIHVANILLLHVYCCDSLVQICLPCYT